MEGTEGPRKRKRSNSSQSRERSEIERLVNERQAESSSSEASTPDKHSVWEKLADLRQFHEECQIGPKIRRQEEAEMLKEHGIDPAYVLMNQARTAIYNMGGFQDVNLDEFEPSVKELFTQLQEVIEVHGNKSKEAYIKWDEIKKLAEESDPLCRALTSIAVTPQDSFLRAYNRKNDKDIYFADTVSEIVCAELMHVRLQNLGLTKRRKETIYNIVRNKLNTGEHQLDSQENNTILKGAQQYLLDTKTIQEELGNIDMEDNQNKVIADFLLQKVSIQKCNVELRSKGLKQKTKDTILGIFQNKIDNGEYQVNNPNRALIHEGIKQYLLNIPTIELYSSPEGSGLDKEDNPSPHEITNLDQNRGSGGPSGLPDHP